MGRLILVFVIGLSCTLFSDVYADSDHDKAYELLLMGQILPLEKILKITREQVQGRVLEVELEYEGKQLIYELEVLDNKGLVWEIKVDAVTGEILKKEED